MWIRYYCLVITKKTFAVKSVRSWNQEVLVYSCLHWSSTCYLNNVVFFAECERYTQVRKEYKHLVSSVGPSAQFSNESLRKQKPASIAKQSHRKHGNAHTGFARLQDVAHPFQARRKEKTTNEVKGADCVRSQTPELEVSKLELERKEKWHWYSHQLS